MSRKSQEISIQHNSEPSDFENFLDSQISSLLIKEKKQNKNICNL